MTIPSSEYKFNKPQRKRRQHIEDKLHENVWKLLCLILPDTCLAWSVENRSLGKIRGALNKRRGCIPGVPDLHFIYEGKWFGIELKSPTNKLSPNQCEFIKRAVKAGCIIEVCRSEEDVIFFLKKMGVPLKGDIS